MPSTRSSARQAAQKATSSSPPNASQSKASPATGSKRKAEGGATGKAKKGKKGQAKEQTTIEDAMPNVEANDESKDVEMKDAIETKKEDSNAKAPEAESEQKDNGSTGDDAGNGAAATEKEAGAEDSKPDTAPAKPQETVTNGASKDSEPKKNGFDTLMTASANSGKEEDTANKLATPEGTGSAVPPSASAITESSARASTTPSSILEKGLIYFFFRPRVGIDSPSSPTEIARSYIILRPIPHSSALGSGPIGDAKNIRLLALPKKVLPLSPKDRFMVFVEKAAASMDDIKSTLSSSDYATKTAGARHAPAAAPIGEGVYAITSTGEGRGQTHLAYMLTRPEEVGEVQDGVGLKKQGSYITSAKNPTAPAPTGASLPKGAEYPKE